MSSAPVCPFAQTTSFALHTPPPPSLPSFPMAAFSATLAATSPSAASSTAVTFSVLGSDTSGTAHDGTRVSSAKVPAARPTGKELLSRLLQQPDWERSAVLRGRDAAVLAATHPLTPEESQALVALFEADRDTAVGRGLLFLGERYEVHCFQPPLVYGRRGSGENSKGIALVKGVGADAEPFIALTTYAPPLVSACIVPQLISFFHSNLGIVPHVAVPPLYEQFLRTAQHRGGGQAR
ncbi:hypothetical protein BESB_078370 [Besnoitia besnoiti]|uniref:Profilin n=1 Tax=Besnoitia besnoiti TaxID=94643 RepID=A0A2A9MBD8_BESBE|nr:hypothetical protein BESB_078370 [Besnoitia besnoiti]PFH33621.1 hypothetical protein BESB_078370 [Besnoitia besnoiti]